MSVSADVDQMPLHCEEAPPPRIRSCCKHIEHCRYRACTARGTHLAESAAAAKGRGCRGPERGLALLLPKACGEGERGCVSGPRPATRIKITRAPPLPWARHAPPKGWVCCPKPPKAMIAIYKALALGLDARCRCTGPRASAARPQATK
jgi:hypothetical protein